MKRIILTLLFIPVATNIAIAQILPAFYVGGDNQTFYYYSKGYLHDHTYGDSIKIEYKYLTGSFSYPYVYVYKDNMIQSVDMKSGEINDIFKVQDLVLYRKLSNGHMFIDSASVKESEEIVHYYDGQYVVLKKDGKRQNIFVETDGKRKMIASQIGYEDPIIWKQFVAYVSHGDSGSFYNLYNIKSGKNYNIEPTESWYRYTYYFDPEENVVIYENQEYLIEYDLGEFD